MAKKTIDLRFVVVGNNQIPTQTDRKETAKKIHFILGDVNLFFQNYCYGLIILEQQFSMIIKSNIMIIIVVFFVYAD